MNRTYQHNKKFFRQPLTYFSGKLSDSLLWRVERCGAGGGQLLRKTRILESQQRLE